VVTLIIIKIDTNTKGKKEKKTYIHTVSTWLNFSPIAR